MKKKLKSMFGILILALLMCFVVGITAFADKAVTGTKMLSESLNKKETASPSEAVKPDDMEAVEDKTDIDKAAAGEKRTTRAATESNAKFIPVEGVHWKAKGWATWDQDQLTEEEKSRARWVSVEIYKNGQWIGNGDYDDEEDFYAADVRYHFMEEGDYTFRAAYVMTSDWGVPEDMWSDFSDVCPYSFPDKRMDTPTGLEWLSDGTIKWDEVSSGSGNTTYVTELYKKNLETGEYECIERGGLTDWNRTSRYVRKMETGATYKFKVVALGDLEEYANSEVSEFSKEFFMGTVSDQGNNIIEDITKGDVKENVENANLTEDEKGALKLAVQTDTGVAQNYAALEESYKESAGKGDLDVATGESGVDASKVTVVGGVLNGATGIRFDKPSQEDLDSAGVTNYRKWSAVNISLEGDVPDDLKFPVLITMPVPEGIDPADMTIIHIRHDGTKETILPRVNGDGTVSFAVTEFSSFLFVDNTQTGGDPPVDEGGSTGGSSGGGGGGSSSGGKATVKADPSETAGTWVQDDIGWWFKRVDGTYPISQWLMNGGSWYRFDEKGYMMTGWFTDASGKKFYLNPVSDGTRGAMKTGWQVIDEKWYYFNPVSNGNKGALLTDTTTPDGYTVNADGVWVQ